MKLILLSLLCFVFVSAKEQALDILTLEKRLQKMQEDFQTVQKQQSISIGGRIQLDSVINRPSVNENGGSNTYDYYLTPNSFNNNAKTTKVSSNIKSSRIWLKSRRHTEIGLLKSLIEIDFWGSGGNEIATNSHHLRIRHAYINLNQWTLGQTFSTFMGNSLPDIILVSSDSVFVRQPQIRYSHTADRWAFDIALESPESKLITLDTNNSKNYNDDPFFDTIARVRYENDDLKLALAGMLRPIAVEANNTIHQEIAWGANATLKYNFKNQNYVQASLASGKGMGRYLSLGFFNAGEYDPTKHNIELLRITSGHLSYTQKINAKLRSTLLLSRVTTYHSDQLQVMQPEKTSVGHLNLRYMPFSKSLVTLEYAVGERVTNTFNRQKLHRLMASISYTF